MATGSGRILGRIDRLAGDALERLVRAHHRRRLAGLGHGEVLDGPSGGWAGGDFPPREGNAFEVLVDGGEALPAIAEEMKRARSFVHVAGWHVAPGFRLSRDPGEPALRDLLAELAERVEVRVLVWAGPPLPVFEPHRSDVRAARDELTRGTRVRCALDARERTMHCHHEKIVIVDGEVAFVGGIDLTDLAGDRYDEPRHHPRGALGWHDAAVRLRGPVVGDAAEHFAQRWREVTGESAPGGGGSVEVRAGEVTAQLVRTVPEKTYGFAPRGEFGIADSYLRALRSAERLVYLENQFLWSAEVVALLCDKLRRPPRDDFRLVLVLPARPNNGADTTRGQLACLVDADGEAGRLLAVTLAAHAGDRTDPLYVHAKIGIVDDRWLTVGSANLNEHSLFNDTEVNVVTHDPGLARATRLRLWAEHLGMDEDALGGDPAAVIDGVWWPIAEEELRRRRVGEPATHRMSRLPGVSRRTERLEGPLRGLLVDG